MPLSSSSMQFSKLDRILKYTAFGSAAVLTLILILATVLEKSLGSGIVFGYIYRSPVFAVLWAVAVTACAAVISRSRQRLPMTVCVMHLSFIFILAGALATFIAGEKGALHLRYGQEPEDVFVRQDGSEARMPFAVSLEEFNVDFYPGTRAPEDYCSSIRFRDGEREEVMEVSMNNICRYRGYRFYQASYDSDLEGTTLAVSRDPWGIALTYTGFILLLGSMLVHMQSPSGAFRRALRKVSRGMAVCSSAILLLLPASCSDRTAAAGECPPRTLPKELAREFGNLYIYYNDRVAPVQTFAREFTLKLTGRASWKGLTPEQVLAGWVFYYDSWKDEPMIRVKGAEMRSLLGGRYVSMMDFFTENNIYKLGDGYASQNGAPAPKDVLKMDDRFNVLSMTVTGAALRLFPYNAEDGTLRWYASTDDLPFDMESGEWLFVRKVLSLIREDVMLGDMEAASEVVAKLRRWQEEKAGDALPPAAVWKAEKLYNAADRMHPLAMGTLFIGILLFGLTCGGMISSRARRLSHRIVGPVAVFTGMIFVYMTLLLVLRWTASGHIPMSNGFETMMMIAWSACLLSLVAFRKVPVIQPFAVLVCGFALLVASIGESDPGMTSLMPVLASPLLSVHVACMMVSYALFGLLALNGLTGVIAGASPAPRRLEAVSALADVGRLLLYPALFLLTAGTVIGAVWANVSWGSYWAWDPKEVWALITILVYAAALHGHSLKPFDRPLFFHWYTLAAFLCVLVTYFGVNFFLGGMHSYA